VDGKFLGGFKMHENFLTKLNDFFGRAAAAWKGDIAEFSGGEEIHYQGELVFTHKFIGGLIEP
jgi:hypothetical protein